MLPEQEVISIPARLFKPQWIVLFLVAMFAGMFALSAFLKSSYRGWEYRRCVDDVHSQIKLANGWNIVGCEPGDWSMDFVAKVEVPAGKSSKEVIDEFERLNSPAAFLSDDRHLSIEPEGALKNTFEIRLDNAK